MVGGCGHVHADMHASYLVGLVLWLLELAMVAAAVPASSAGAQAQHPLTHDHWGPAHHWASGQYCPANVPG